MHIAGQVGVGTDDSASVPTPRRRQRRRSRTFGSHCRSGAGWEHVVKLMIYVVDFDETEMGEFGAGMGQATEPGDDPDRYDLDGVQAPYRPDILVEIEAIAEV